MTRPRRDHPQDIPGGSHVATIVVGIEDSLRAEDAVALAGELARAAGAEVRAVCAYPFDPRPAAHFNASMRDPLRQAAEETLEALCQPLSDLPVVHRVAIADPSPARALLTEAAACGAALIVVGYHGRPRGTAWRLLQGSPYPVALAPPSQRLRPHSIRRRVVAAFDGSDGAHAAVFAASVLARVRQEPLRIVTVFDPDVAAPAEIHAPPGFLRITQEAEHEARSRLERVVATVPSAEPAFLIGDPARELTRESEVSDLLVVGSRSYGPSPALLLGGVSGRLIETAACPVLVVPNGVPTPLSALEPLTIPTA
jgi:nucleotide-binding universal stress UspA family protein